MAPARSHADPFGYHVADPAGVFVFKPIRSFATLVRRVTGLTESPPARSGRARIIRGLVICGAGCYLAVVLAIWLLTRIAADRWWPATLLMFGPRWPLALPLLLLLPASVAVRGGRRIVALSAALLLLAVLGFEVPLPRWPSQCYANRRLTILTCNIHRQRLDARRLAQFIESSHVDVVALQEWSSRHQADLFAGGGWFLRRDQDELLLASRFPIRRVEPMSIGTPGNPGAAVAYELETPQGVAHLINIHLASPHRQLEAIIDGEDNAAAGIEANSLARSRQSAEVSSVARQLGPFTLIAGDFNTPDQSSVFRHSWRGFSDAFAEAGWGFGNTYYARRARVRIDHVVFAGGWRCRQCRVGPDVGSPHRPVVAQLERLPASDHSPAAR
jgi:vancomycin resistance protein VanJ